jgi:hypothetical protein
MDAKKSKRPNPGRRGNLVSLAPLTPNQALAGLLKITPADAADVRQEAKMGKPTKPKRAK